MKIIREPNSTRIGCIGQQKIIRTEKYRPLTYTTYVEIEDGYLAYNNLTDELIILTQDEKAQLDNFDSSNEICRTFIEKWYFVPENHSDANLCDQLDGFMKLLLNSTVNGSIINKYTIFPTTDCNARCFYCYEKGIQKKHMSEQTALDVADYIIKHCGGKEVTIRWFGGEPLYNNKVIDIICKKLSEANIKFVSAMISNGYLFDDEIIEKAVKLWNLKRVQITLDGTEKIYNKVKAFIYPNVNAFERVILNIEKLLKVNINVVIRMNMDSHNYKNLFELVNFLCEKFKDNKNLRMYSQTLFDESSEKHMNRTDDDRDKVFNNNQIINDYIIEHNFGEIRTLKGYLKNNQCMADDNNATTITPDGNLGKCEHFSDKYFWGSIYSDEINQENIQMFKRVVPLIDKCYSCPVKPGCLQLENCPDGRRCNETLQMGHFKNVKKLILATYHQWIKENVTD